MRITGYRREFYCEDKHIITNTPESYKGDISSGDVTAMHVNQICPSIRISNVPQKNGKVKVDIADQAELNMFLDDEDITPEFRENYIKILRGELPSWKLFAVELNPNGNPCLNFINEDTGASEHLFIERVPGLQMMFELDRVDGRTDKYLLKIEHGSCDGTSMVLTEYYNYGRCEIIFDGTPICKSNPADKQWEYIYVTEILY